MTRNRTEIQNLVNNLGYELLDEYMNKNYRMVIIRDDVGYKYDVGLNDLIHENHTILIFHKGNPFTLENISLWLEFNNKNFQLCKDNIYEGDNKKLTFFCFKCRECFYMNWRDVKQGNCCAVCAGKQVVEKTSLAYLRPDLIDEFIKSKNNKNPKNLSLMSHEDVFWRCSECGHEWWAFVSTRTSQGCGCPKCAEERYESKIATECKKYFIEHYNAISEHKLLRNPETNFWLKCDIYIPNNIYVEIHGHQHFKINTWHKLLGIKNNRSTEEEFKYRQHLDKIKKDYCEENGLYIEIDIRKIKSSEEAIKYIESILESEIKTIGVIN